MIETGSTPAVRDAHGGLAIGRMRMAAAVVHADGQVTEWSRAAEEMTGYPADEVIGRDISFLSHSNLEMSGRDIVHALLEQSGQYGAGRVRCRDGTVRTVEWRAFPLPQQGAEDSVVIVVIEAMGEAAAGTELALLDVLAQQASVGIGVLDTQLRYIYLNEALARISGYPIAEHLGHTVREIHDVPYVDEFESLLAQVIETGKPVIDLHIPAWRPAGRERNRVWSVNLFRLEGSGMEILGVCGLIVDVTARETAIVEASRNRSRLALINEATRRIGTTLELERTAAELAEVAVPSFADLVTVDLLDEVLSDQLHGAGRRNRTLHRVATRASFEHPAIKDFGREADPTRYPPDSVFASALRSGKPVLVQNMSSKIMEDCVGRDPHRAGAARALPFGSCLTVPLAARGVTLGIVTFHRVEEREEFRDDDVQLAEDLASRAAMSIDNARLFRRERDSALTLQRSLLPGSLPELPGVEIRHCYRPGSDTAEAGGDWYDAIALPGRRVGLVIGDVMGHGIQAAAAMGSFRTAMHTLAMLGLPPGPLLMRLDELAATLDEDTMATCVYSVYDPVEGMCAIASAGHPPPILMTPGGEPRLIDVEPGTPLGAGLKSEFRASVVPVEPGSLLLLYTDGLVESRLRDIDVGIEAVCGRLATLKGSLEEVCVNLVDLSPPGSSDDVALLAARLNRL